MLQLLFSIQSFSRTDVQRTAHLRRRAVFLSCD